MHPKLNFERVASNQQLSGYDELRCVEMAKAFVKTYNSKYVERPSFGVFYSELLLFMKDASEASLLEIIMVDDVIVGRRKGTFVALYTICKADDVDNLRVN